MRCPHCQQEHEFESTVSMGRRAKRCTGCHELVFEDENPGGVNTTKTSNSA